MRKPATFKTAYCSLADINRLRDALSKYRQDAMHEAMLRHRKAMADHKARREPMDFRDFWASLDADVRYGGEQPQFDLCPCHDTDETQTDD